MMRLLLTIDQPYDLGRAIELKPFEDGGSIPFPRAKSEMGSILNDDRERVQIKQSRVAARF